MRLLRRITERALRRLMGRVMKRVETIHYV